MSKPASASEDGAVTAQQLMAVAQAGDQLDEAALAALHAFALAQMDALNAALDQATEQAVIDQILARQNRLGEQANALTGLSVQLTAGEARVSAEHIQAAVDSAQRVMAKVASVKAKLAVVGAVIDFTAAVLSGQGKAIVAAAKGLKAELDAQG